MKKKMKTLNREQFVLKVMAHSLPFTNIQATQMQKCAFRGIWAVISRDLGHAFHGIAGSHFTLPGRLANG
jgi:hypothetical protein